MPVRQSSSELILHLSLTAHFEVGFAVSRFLWRLRLIAICKNLTLADVILIDFSYRYAALDLVLWLFVIQIQFGVFLGAYAMSLVLV